MRTTVTIVMLSVLSGCVSDRSSPSSVVQQSGKLYVASFNDGVLWVLDAASGKELQHFDNFDRYKISTAKMDQNGDVSPREEERPAALGDIAIAGRRLFVEQVFCDSLLVFDITTANPIGRIKTKGNGRLAVSPDGKYLYFARNDQTGFCIIDSETFEQKEIAYPVGGRGIGAVAVSPDGARVYLGIQRGARDAGADRPSEAAGPVDPLQQTHSGPFLAIYDISKGRYVALKSIGDTLVARGDDASIPSAFAFSGDGQTLYIGMQQCMAGVHVFDTAVCELRAPITFASRNKSFPWPGCVDVAVRGQRLYVTVQSTTELVEIDARTRRTLRVFPLGGAGRMTLSGRWVFVCGTGLQRLLLEEP